MSRFEVIIKNMDLDINTTPEIEIVNNDAQKILFSSSDSIHISSQGNIITIIFDNDAEYFPAFSYCSQSINKIDHSYEIIIKANDKFDRLMVAKYIELSFSDIFKKYANQWGTIDLINDNDKNELHFNINGMLEIELIILIIPTAEPSIHYYDVAEEG